MRRKIAAATAGLLILAGLGATTAEGNGNPWEGLQATVDGLIASDAEQDARLDALEARNRQLTRKLRRESNLRISYDRQLATCGKLGFLDWRFNGKLVFRHVDVEQVFWCFYDVKANAKRSRP